MTSEVASTRLPASMLREIDRHAAARGMPRSSYLAYLIELGAAREAMQEVAPDWSLVQSSLVAGLQHIRDQQDQLIRTASTILSRVPQPTATTPSSPTLALVPFVDRITFATLFSECILKRASGLLNKNPGEVAVLLRDARNEARAEAERLREIGSTHELK